jgi:hypothetical protein
VPQLVGRDLPVNIPEEGHDVLPQLDRFRKSNRVESVIALRWVRDAPLRRKPNPLRDALTVQLEAATSDPYAERCDEGASIIEVGQDVLEFGYDHRRDDIFVFPRSSNRAQALRLSAVATDDEKKNCSAVR